MGERGPKPLPGNVHLLRGNPSKLPAGKLLDTVRPEVSIPEAPDVLCPDGLFSWCDVGGRGDVRKPVTVEKVIQDRGSGEI